MSRYESAIKHLKDMIRVCEYNITSEKLAGNIVKEAYAKGECAGYVHAQEWMRIQPKQVCRWAMTHSCGLHPHYRTECGGTDTHKDGGYCPRCGNEIEVAT